MSAEIRKLIDGDVTVYPLTVGEAVSLEDGSTVQDLADAFEDFDPNVLKTAPTFKKVSTDNVDPNHFDPVYQIYHPYMNKPGAEIVLMHYSKKNGKKYRTTDAATYRHYKKGWCVAAGAHPGSGQYFTFSASTPMSSVKTYYDNNLMDIDTRHFGIALRLPNPQWNRAATKQKNGTYKGVPESLWSDVLAINVHTNKEHFTGIGILR